MPRTSRAYEMAFKAAAVVAPLVMGIVGYLYGDVSPVVHDVCEMLLPQGVVMPLERPVSHGD